MNIFFQDKKTVMREKLRQRNRVVRMCIRSMDRKIRDVQRQQRDLRSEVKKEVASTYTEYRVETIVATISSSNLCDSLHIPHDIINLVVTFLPKLDMDDAISSILRYGGAHSHLVKGYRMAMMQTYDYYRLKAQLNSVKFQWQEVYHVSKKAPLSGAPPMPSHRDLRSLRRASYNLYMQLRRQALTSESFKDLLEILHPDYLASDEYQLGDFIMDDLDSEDTEDVRDIYDETIIEILRSISPSMNVQIVAPPTYDVCN